MHCTGVLLRQAVLGAELKLAVRALSDQSHRCIAALGIAAVLLRLAGVLLAALAPAAPETEDEAQVGCGSDVRGSARELVGVGDPLAGRRREEALLVHGHTGQGGKSDLGLGTRSASGQRQRVCTTRDGTNVHEHGGGWQSRGSEAEVGWLSEKGRARRSPEVSKPEEASVPDRTGRPGGREVKRRRAGETNRPRDGETERGSC